ncbi:MAG: hypothetical protein KY457_10825 [Actinobacteria bacterium]|nr:hypothetical protein [Actinomycetota bacterium]
MAIAHRPPDVSTGRRRVRGRVASTLLLVAALGLGACGGDEPGPPDLARPSQECEDAFAAAEEAGERAGPESPRSPDIDLLKETLEACGTADEWMTAVRGHEGALPIELDRETALDQLCVRNTGTAVCTDWTSSGSGAGEG